METLERREMLAAEMMVTEFLASNDSGLLDGNGNRSDWIEIHNAGDMSQDITGWYLTDTVTNPTRWSVPAVPEALLDPGDYLVVFASGDGTPDLAGNLHTNFGLSASGEYLAMLRPDLTVVSEFSPEYPSQRTDISYGIDSSVVSGDQERFFLTPTPGTANGIGLEGFVSDTAFSVDRGYYDQAFTVDITSSTPGSTIVYTTDGSVPSATNGTQVSSVSPGIPTATVSIAGTTVLRAMAMKTGFQSTNVDTQTYLFLGDVITQPDSPAGYPTAWGSAPAADYGMDPQIVNDPAYTQELLDGLRDLPALTVAGNVDDLFGPSGIYSNTNNSNLESAVSAEYILPDGSTGFQIDAGLKVAGGASRNPNNSPKHSMSLRFRNQYGASRLEYPLFEGSNETFNSLQLRAMYNNSWIHWSPAQRLRGTLIRDQFVRDSLIAAGQDDAGRGNYAHVYLNGIYWGVFNVHERADSSHYADYNGGDSDSYDALNGGSPVDGTITSWNNLKATVAGGDWNAIEQVLDVDNFIDWTLANAYGGNADLKTNGNWRAAGGGIGDGRWRMYAWDSERILEGVTDRAPNQITDATGMYGDLIQVPEFVVRLGDRIQKHFFNGGIFTPEKVAERWDARVNELSKAIVAESARWGDYRRDVHVRGSAFLYERDLHWTPEIDRIIADVFPGRTSFVANAYEGLGLFPSVDAPLYQVNGTEQSGGQVTAGSELRLASSESLYYTVDGTDPRDIGGGISASAILYNPNTVETTPLSEGSNWRYHDLGIDLGTAWREPAFDDSLWADGEAELGYGESDETTVVSFGPNASQKYRTTYFRTTFEVPTGGQTLATLRLKRDDGAVVFLNGVEIARDNLPAGLVSFSTPANQAAPDDGNAWLEFSFDPSLLEIGTNSLAVEIHQNSNTSSDLSFDAEVVLATQTEPPLILNDSLSLRSRARAANGDWSAIHDALFLVPHVPASADNLRISEVNYDPFVDGDAEFIELHNITSGAGGVTIDLDGITVTDGPSAPFTVPVNTTLAPGQYALLVRDTSAFLAAYPSVDPALVVGEYDGKLSNGGERIRLEDASGVEVVDFEYGDSDPWPAWASGRGGTLVLDQPALVPASESGKPYHWRDSVEPGGTPGAPSVSPVGVIINEVLSHTDAPLSDAIELYNPTNANVDLSGWFLSDNGSVREKYQIPSGTILPAGGYVTFDESDFNPVIPGPGNLINFALNGSDGDSVWLSKPDSGELTLVDQVSFGATFNGVSLGRLADSGGRLVPLANRSLGVLNGTFAASNVFVSEVNYHPEPPTATALAIDSTITETDLEFIELINGGVVSESLSGWRLRGEGDLDFPVNTTLAAGQTVVVVSFDPEAAVNVNRLAAFREHYSIDSSVDLVGPFTGSLDNHFGLVRLQRPDSPPIDQPTLTPYVLVDELFYDDLAPWPVEADGTGPSLQRIGSNTLGVYSGSWRAEPATPGDSPARPAVESVTINNGHHSRSLVTEIRIQFDTEVVAPAEAFEITDRSSEVAIENLLVSSSVENGKTVAVIRFGAGPLVQSRGNGPHSLVDGSYQLRLYSTMIETAGSEVGMAEDYLFGTQAADGFFRFFGDTDGDLDVDFQDQTRFGQTHLKNLGQAGFDEQLDFDGDGDVDSRDYGQLQQRLRRTLRF